MAEIQQSATATATALADQPTNADVSPNTLTEQPSNTSINVPLPPSPRHSSRPVTPSRQPSNTSVTPLLRRPSSSLSRRASLLTPSYDPLAAGPQRLPRKPSSDFAELHQELEQEQEAVVNRLLNMIRRQQEVNSSASSVDGDAVSTAATVDSNSTAGHRDRGMSPSRVTTGGHPLSRESSFRSHGGRSNSRRSRSRRASGTGGTSLSPSPVPIPGRRLHHAGSSESMLLESPAHSSYSREGDATFFMIEAQNLGRENEMLKRRIRELEREVSRLMRNSDEASTATSETGEGLEVHTPTSSAFPDDSLSEIGGSSVKDGAYEKA